MDDLEQQLKQALARKDAPTWLEAHVQEALRKTDRRPWYARWFVPAPFRWATAALAATLVIAGVWQHERAVHERAAGEAAKEQLMIALQITSSKLHIIQEKVEAVSYGHQESAE
jgi:hypothetical protein